MPARKISNPHALDQERSQPNRTRRTVLTGGAVGLAAVAGTTLGGLGGAEPASAQTMGPVWVSPSGDTSGATDTTNINNAIKSLPNGGVVGLNPGLFYVTSITVPAQVTTGYSVSILGSGSATVVYVVGGGTGFSYHRTSGYGAQFGLPAQQTVGFLRDFVIDGTHATSGAVGLDVGDGWNFDISLVVVNFTASYSFTAATSSRAFTASGTSYPGAFAVMLSGTNLPGGFKPGVVYYTTNVSGAKFDLAAYVGGPVITPTSTGSGTVTGTIPAWITNRVFWCEKGHYRLQLMNNSIAGLLDTAVPSNDHSHEYNVFDFNIFCSAGQQGIVLNSGVNLGGCELWLHGNMASLASGVTPAQAGLAALSINGTDGAGDYSRLYESEIIMKVEGNQGDGAGTAYPYGIQFGSSNNGIKQSGGIITHSLSNSNVNNAEFSFRGQVSGDPNLSLAYTGAPGSGQTSTSPPAVPASGTAQQNYGPDQMVYVTGGSVSNIAVNTVPTGQTSGAFFVPAGGIIKLTYSAKPSWTWVPAAYSAY
ncbi:MAG TPA: hypothetical protein VGS19_13730 [Streptosporangiaceae bacterium]|nr:hypothetical protein [Streptosporangiaceae bacterium]